MNPKMPSRFTLLLLAAALLLSAKAGWADNFYTVTPCRVFDTRTTNPPAMQGQVSRFIPVVGAGGCGVPAEATAIAVNITVTNGTAGGKMKVGAGDANLPSAVATTRITFQPGQTRANDGIVQLAKDGPSGVVKGVRALAETGVSDTVDLIIDINGFFQAGPLLTAGGGSPTFTEDGPAVVVDPGLTIVDPSSTTLASATVLITNPQDGAAEVLAATSCAGLTVTPGLNILSITGVQPLATYQTCLRSVTYSDSSQNPGTTPRDVAFSANDGTATSNTATTTVNVTPVDDPPVAVDDSATVTEDDPATAINVLANDTDVDGGPKSIASVTQPANGSVVITGGGTGLTYQPNANYCNNPPGTTPDTFTYTLTPGSSTATVSVTVTCVDDPPVAVNDSATVTEDDPATAINVLANDTDIDGGPKSIASVTQPANGSVVITGGGTGLTYQPNANYCNNPPGTTLDTFTYTLTPGSSTATVTVTVTCVDDPPVAVNDSATVSEDDPATAVDVLANDTDIDGGPKSIASVTQPANGSVVITGGGTGLTYQPNANYCNNPPGTTPDTFTYTLTPGSSTATVSVTVTCVDDPPVAVNDTATVNEDSGANAIDVLANDTDIDGGPKSVASVTQPVNGSVAITGGGTGVDYTPNANYCQTNVTTAAQYRLGENDPGAAAGNTGDDPTVALVGGVNLPRVGSPAYSGTTPPAVASTLSMSFNGTSDSYAAGTLASTAVDNFGIEAWVRSNGSVTGNAVIAYNGSTAASGWGLVRIGGKYGYSFGGVSSAGLAPVVAGVWTHLALVRQSGTATFYVNGYAVSTSAAVPNTPALASSGGMMIGGNLAGSEFFDGEVDEVRIFTFSAGQFSVSDLTLSGSPTRTSPDTFTYTLSPGGSSATVSVAVTCVDDPPVAVDDTATVAQSAPATAIDVLINDTDIDGGPRSIGSVTQPANGSVVITGGGAGLTYQPNTGYCNTPPGTTPDTFTYTLTPGSSTATVSVKVTCDTPPTAVNDAATVTEDDPATAINVLANDTDPDGGPKSIASVTQPANGVVVITGGGTGLTYKPNANYCNNPPGTTLDTFTYTLTPGGSTATVTVTVTCVDDPPVAVNDSATVTEDDPATAINVLANDTDVDGGPKSIASVTQPANGVVVITGGGTGLTYKPNANYCNNPPGTTLDTFTYTLTPGSSTATVTVTVTCVDDPPVAVNDSATVTEDDPATAINVLANDTDVDGGPKSIGSVTQPANGVVVITGGGTGLTYKPNANYCNNPPGTTLDTFTYTLTPGSSTATVTVTVTCVDDPPVAVNDAATVTEDDPATAINVLANDTDVDGGPKSIASVTQPANGVVVITGGGTGLTYKPNANYCNNPPGTTPDTFTYTLTPGSSTATVSVLVTCVNDPPVPTTNPITYTTPGNTQLHVAGATLPGVASWSDAQSIDTKAGPFSDPDGPSAPTIVVASGSSVNGGSYSIINTNGAFTYVPPAGFTGVDSFTYQVTDSVTPSTGTINITVGPRVWYVRNDNDANNPAGGDGRSTNAFDTITALNAATTNPGDFIYIFEGTTGTAPLTTAAPLALKDGQKLWGQGIDLIVPSFGKLVNASNQPRLRTATASVDVVTVPATTASPGSTEIRGLDFEATGATSNAISVTATGANGMNITISNDNIRGATGKGINLSASTTGAYTATVQNDTVTSTGIGVSTTTNAAGTVTVTSSTNTISSAANALDARTAAGAGSLVLSVHDNTVQSGASGIVIDGSAAGTTTITNFANNAVSGSTVGSGILVTSAKFDNVPGGSFDQVSGGSTVIGASGVGNGVGASGMVLTNVAGDLGFTDLDIFADGGAGLRASGTTAYTGSAGFRIGFPGVVSPVANVTSNGGPAVDLSTVAMNNFIWQSINSSISTATTGAAFNSVTGTFSAAAGGITNSAGTGFQVGSSNATISYAGTINTTGGKGVDLTSNTGSTISFTGALTLSSGSNTAFNATGAGPAATSGGTVTATNTTSTLTSTTGTALNVANTTIGASGLKFQSISANGAPSGIVLNNTGASGSLSVLGTGAAASGGTIQNTTSHGISLTSTLSPSFDRMNIQNTSGSGVKGTTVTNFTFTNGTVNNSGTGGGTDESNIAFNTSAAGTENNVSGTVTITGNTLTNSLYHGIDILNFNGTLSNVTLTGNTLTSSTTAASSLGSGIRLQASGSATTVANITKATLSTNTISNFPSASGILINCGNPNASGSGGICGTPATANNVSVTSNTIKGQSSANKMGSNAIAVSVTGGNGASRSQANFDLSSNGTVANPLTNFKGSGAACTVLGMSTATCNVANNVMVANNIVASRCISVGVDRTLAASDTPDLTATITGNNVSACDGNDIFTGALNSNGTARIKVQNNTLAAPLSGVRTGIQVNSGTPSAAGTNTTVCLNISGNTSAGSGGNLGIGLRKEGTVATTNAFGVNGMAATSSPGVESYVDGLNPAGGGTILTSATSGFTSCSLP